jgi:hypothetical protein
VVAPADVRRIAPAASADEAAARLYQALYGCTMHPAGLLHSIAACLDAEAEGRFTLDRVAYLVERRTIIAQQTARPADAWRLGVMVALCQRLRDTSA